MVFKSLESVVSRMEMITEVIKKRDKQNFAEIQQIHDLMTKLSADWQDTSYHSFNQGKPGGRELEFEK